MFDIQKFWNNWDKFAVAAHFIGMAVAICFFLFVIWFMFIKIKPLNMKKEMERKQFFNEEVEEIRSEQFDTQQRNNSLKSQISILRQQSMMNSLKRVISEKIWND